MYKYISAQITVLVLTKNGPKTVLVLKPKETFSRIIFSKMPTRIIPKELSRYIIPPTSRIPMPLFRERIIHHIMISPSLYPNTPYLNCNFLHLQTHSRFTFVVSGIWLCLVTLSDDFSGVPPQFTLHT